MEFETDVVAGKLYKPKDCYLSQYYEEFEQTLYYMTEGNNGPDRHKMPEKWIPQDLLLVLEVEGPSGWNSEGGQNRIHLLLGDKEFVVGEGWFLAYYEMVK